MNTAMLWYDNDPKTDITTKIDKAVSYYRNKYNKIPNLCFVHPSMIKSSPIKAGGMEVRSSRSVMPNHFWLGVAQP